MAAAKYFWGQSVSDPVQASPASTFRELVAICINSPYTLPVTQDEYHDLPKKERDKIKTELPLLVPSVFQQTPSRRKRDEALHCNLIFLDIDVEPDGSCPAAPYFHNPEALKKQLSPFAFAAYMTTSSTPDKPRMRIMVSADKIPLDKYPLAVRTIAERIGLKIVTPESERVVQPMFLPSIFKDANPETDHPYLVGMDEGAAFKEKHITVTEDDAAPHAKAFTERQQMPYGDDALAYLRPPVTEVTLEIAKEALSVIDPDIGYNDWFDIALALRHQFSPKKVEEAFQIFDEWSSQGNKYPGQDEVLYKWNSTRATPIGRVPVTIRSLLHKAVEHGWQAQHVKELCFENTMAWVQDTKRTATELMVESLTKIAATPLLSFTEEDVLLHVVVKQAKALHKLPLSVSSLRTDLKKLKEANASKDDGEKPSPPSWLKGWCYVASHNEFFRQHTGEKLLPEQFNNAYSFELLPTEEQLNDMKIAPTMANLSKPLIRPQDFALNFHQIQVVYDYKYDPANPQKTFTKRDGKYFVNTYVRAHPTPNPKSAPIAERFIRKHLQMLIEEEEYQLHILDWLAYNVQYPGRKVRHAILLQGGEGCGKTFLYELGCTALGARHCKKINKGTLEKGWTEWAVGSQIIAVEEIRVVGKNRHEVMAMLKELVTNDTVPVNKRHTSTATEENITNYILFSNYKDALALTEGDRRYFVVMSRLQDANWKEIRSIADSGYYQRLFDMLKEHASGVRHFFENYQIRDSFNPNGPAPRTSYAEQIIHDVRDDVTAMVKSIIEDGKDPLINEDLIASANLADHFQLEGMQRPSGPHLASILRAMNYDQRDRISVGPDGRRQYIWVRVGALKNVTDLGAYARGLMQNKELLEDLW